LSDFHTTNISAYAIDESSVERIEVLESDGVAPLTESKVEPAADHSLFYVSGTNPGTMSPGKLGLLLIGGIALLSMFVEYFSGHLSGWQGYYFADQDWHPELLACLSLVPLAFFIASYYRHRRIRTDDGGITVETQHADYKDGRFISWKQVRSIKTNRIGWEHLVTIETKGGDATRFLWRHLQESLDPAEFFSAVRAYCPGALPPAVPKLSDAGNHTRLWLDSFSQAQGRKCSSSLDAGRKLQNGKFEILGQIGQGGQGTAYAAAVLHDVSDGDNQETDGLPDEVVLKEYILPMHHFKTQSILTESAEKLNRAAAILERIEHPQIVRMYGHFVEDYRGYLVMERVEGISLKELVGTEGKQPESVVIDIANQVCDILSYLHEQPTPIVHRDLTPDNLILQADGKVKLVDFDVAHQLEASVTANVVGKQAYIPPEQFRGQPISSSDLYALGCTMYYLLTGEEPEPMTTSSPAKLCKKVSKEVDSAVRQATAPDVRERFACASELKQALPAGKQPVKQKDAGA
jgi:hypothetical protein